MADLPGDILAITAGSTIFVDRDAAGHGWFIDPTPDEELEFGQPDGRGAGLAGLAGPANGRMDLLSVVGHELGPVLGCEPSPTGLMRPSLGEGERFSFALLPAPEGRENKEQAASGGCPRGTGGQTDAPFLR